MTDEEFFIYLLQIGSIFDKTEENFNILIERSYIAPILFSENQVKPYGYVIMQPFTSRSKDSKKTTQHKRGDFIPTKQSWINL